MYSKKNTIARIHLLPHTSSPPTVNKHIRTCFSFDWKKANSNLT